MSSLFALIKGVISHPATTTSSTAIAIPKTEGTSRTYGQDIEHPAAVAESSNIQARVVTTSINRNRGRSTPPVSGRSARVRTDAATQVASHPAVAPQDVKVDVVQETKSLEREVDQFGKVGLLDCEVRSNVAVAAASTNENATAVTLKSDTFNEATGPENLLGAVLDSLSSVAPNVVRTAIVVGSAVKSKEDQVKALDEASKVDFHISLKSKESESVEFNFLKTPEIQANLFYNFYEPHEEEIDIQENPEKDPLLKSKPINVSKYVELTWDMVSVTDPLTGTEEIAQKNGVARRRNFTEPQGVSGHVSARRRNSNEKYQSRKNPIERDGVKQNLVDIHDITKGFDSVANPRQFPNTIGAVLDTSEEINNLPSLPVSKIVDI